MKRGLVLISLSLILILSIAPVSASLFSDFWNKITGKVTGNETNGTIPIVPCADTDVSATEPFKIKGTATDSSGSYTDYCSDRRHLVEYSCNGINFNQVSKGCHDYAIPCASGVCIGWESFICSDGACVPNSEHIMACIDSDVPTNPDATMWTTKGTTTDSSGSYTDYCKDEDYLFEYRCNDDDLLEKNSIDCNSYQVNICSNGQCDWRGTHCSDGKCIPNANANQPAPTTNTTNQTSTTSSGGTTGSSGGGGGTISTTGSGGAGGNTSTTSSSGSSNGSGVVSKTNFSVSSVTTTATGFNGTATVTGPSGTTAVSSIQVSSADGKAYATKEDGSKQEIKVDPVDAINSVNKSVKSGTFGEVRIVEYQNKVVYEMDVTKQVKVMAIIPANMTINARVDVEDGNVVSVKKPWWNFLAKEI